jgi:hypothetical protein
MIMGIAALIGMGLSAIGVWLVKTTFEETRKANSIARESMERQLRAYVGAFDLRVEGFRPGNRPVFSFKPTNTGQTPAYEVEIHCGVVLASDPKRGVYNFGGFKFDSKVVLQPHQPVGMTVQTNFPIDEEIHARIHRKEIHMMFAGYIRYRTAFGQLRRTVFSARVNMDLFASGNGDGMLSSTQCHNRAN